jgi:hypothetical protein
MSLVDDKGATMNPADVAVVTTAALAADGVDSVGAAAMGGPAAMGLVVYGWLAAFGSAYRVWRLMSE